MKHILIRLVKRNSCLQLIPPTKPLSRKQVQTFNKLSSPQKASRASSAPQEDFPMGDFEKTSLSDLRNALDCQVCALHGAERSPMRTSNVSLKSQYAEMKPLILSRFLPSHPPTPGHASANFSFAGATASIRGEPRSSALSAAKTGFRAFSQSLARQYQPQNIHVAHFVIGGIIGTERMTGFQDVSVVGLRKYGSGSISQASRHSCFEDALERQTGLKSSHEH
ncbi:hypothetical protein U1Q18_044727 [Sarracenia purpurea var. burkii]